MTIEEFERIKREINVEILRDVEEVNNKEIEKVQFAFFYGLIMGLEYAKGIMLDYVEEDNNGTNA